MEVKEQVCKEAIDTIVNFIGGGLAYNIGFPEIMVNFKLILRKFKNNTTFGSLRK